jgi:trehalose 6-phosphate synthase/phosphatase
MQRRLKRYDVNRWANDFLQTLLNFKEDQKRYNAKLLPLPVRKELQLQFRNSKRRILMLDYDGTLVTFAPEPKLAPPDPEILELLKSLAKQSDVVLLTGRNKKNLEDWFPIPEIHLVAEHGVWIRLGGENWKMLKPLNVNWKEKIISLMEMFADHLPGAMIEEKEFSVAFHFRQSDPEIASIRVKELADNLVHLTANTDVHVLQGSKVLEVRNAGADKGTAALYFLSRSTHDFIFAAGDDWTDEDLFKVLPEEAISIKVGLIASHARYNVRSPNNIRQLLKDFL